MTKKVILALLVLALAVAPVFAQFRLEVGAEVPLGGGYIDSSGNFHNEGSLFGSNIFPIPEVGLSYRIPVLGFMRVGAGLRAFSIIVQTIAFPNVYAEAKFGPFIVEAQVGGLAFASFGSGGTYFETGLNVLVPDISAWIGFGKDGAVRIGGGVIGLSGTKLDSTMTIPVIYYAGAKLILNP